MSQWEYHQEIIPVNPATVTAVCNSAGADGWELVGMLPIEVQPIQKLLAVGNMNVGNRAAVLLQFKRPIGWTRETAQESESLAGV